MHTALLNKLIGTLEDMEHSLQVGYGPPTFGQMMDAVQLAKSARDEVLTEAAKQVAEDQKLIDLLLGFPNGPDSEVAK